jgi:putative oxidoreductase
MESINQYHFIAAGFVARIVLGCLFFFQGFDAVFNLKMRNVMAGFENNFEDKRIPRIFIMFAAWYASYTELIGGALLIAGLFIYPALYLLGINLIIAAIGFGIGNPLWDMRHVKPRLVLLLFLLIIPEAWNIFSLDHLLFNR